MSGGRRGCRLWVVAGMQAAGDDGEGKPQVVYILNLTYMKKLLIF